MQFDEALNLLKMYGQQHILDQWGRLSGKQRENLLDQLAHFRFTRWKEQLQLLHQPPSAERKACLPFVNPTLPDSEERLSKGRKAIAEGKVGCLVLAGGQGSRLRYSSPKGMFPITPIRRKTLFQILSEKVVAAGKQAGRSLPLAIMTSSLNDQETKQFFFDHDVFGLDPHDLFFFQQNNLPYLDEKGNLFLQALDTIAEGPDGNGSFYHSFVESGIFSEWIEQGVRYLQVIPIDNPLADPFDPELIGLLEERQDDAVLIAVERTDPQEKVGLIVQEQGKVLIREYFELPPGLRDETERDGTLTFRLANSNLMALAMDFVSRLAAERDPPLHKVKKRLPTFFPNDLNLPLELIGWKFETFWFDALPLSDQTSVLLRTRDDCFAPLKSLSGQGSILHVQEALERKDKRILEAITGLPAPEEPIELSPLFYYPTEEWKKRWQGRHAEGGGYVE